ncbi:hypothetical protein O181_097131 [Austropuccinia psidii MF-1]|uniref:Uncharacterized protein n=1 Tax=Austropuccinia psidii MF-1 TaxID=1389203 RepID=A0A9Q3J8S6_9BASI|nr:hypothetical protein [Austropuccinia psidii MF-1]
MPIQHPPPERQTRFQARTQAVLTPTPKAPLDGTSVVSQLRAHLDRGPNVEAEAPSRKEGRVPKRSSSFSGTSMTIFRGPGEDGEEEEENSAEEEESDGTEGVPAPVGASQGTEGPTLAQSNQPVSHQSEPWGERALIHHFRKGLPLRILDQLASHPSIIDSLQDLMGFTLELDTRYHERQNEKSHHQEKKPEASKSNSSHPQNSSSSTQKKKRIFRRGTSPILLY